VLELLHFNEEENKFKQLFLIQFNSFFTNENGIRFTKDQIDGIGKDIRYPDELYIDILFDDQKSNKLSDYEDIVTKWKNIISDFILRGYVSNKNETTEEPQKEAEEITKVELEQSGRQQEPLYEKEEDFTSKPNTENKADEILQKFSGKKKIEINEEYEEEDEDIENYLKNLENKIK
jgi:hypothetical protein